MRKVRRRGCLVDVRGLVLRVQGGSGGKVAISISVRGKFSGLISGKITSQVIVDNLVITEIIGKFVGRQ